jgi:PAS domain S-box-containing protein
VDTKEELERELALLRQTLARQEEELAFLRRSEEHCRSMLEDANDLIHSLDGTGCLQYANRLWRETLGYSEDELKKMRIFDIVDPSCQSKCVAIFHRMMQGEETEPTEALFVSKDGRRIMVEGRCSPQYDGEGRPVALLGIFRDISERRQAERKIEQAAREWRNTFDSISDFVSVHDAEMRIVRANRALARLFGAKPEELIGRHCYEVFHGSSEPFAGCPHREAMEQKRPVSREVYEEKVGFPLQITCSPFYDEEGNLLGTVHFAKDISQAKKNERDKELLIARLQEALNEVKILRGFLPICSSCKKIRDDQGQWNQIEAYIRDHTEAEFTHSICPGCVQKLYPEFLQKK